MAERDGAAVVCSNCKGTGAETIIFERFEERKPAKGVERIFKTSAGYIHTSSGTIITDEGRNVDFSEGGCTYREWLDGAEPKPLKNLYCPYQWTEQRLQSKDVNGLYKNRCDKHLLPGGYITKCKEHSDMETCWAIYEGKEKAGR
jgi:hypothetical protein